VRLILKARGFKSIYITTKTDRHHAYIGQGQGPLPPLVFLHGGSDSAATFMPVMLWLQKYTKQIIAVEAAGHGLSDDPLGTFDFARHYESMNIALDKAIGQNDPAILIGNSLGALTAIHYANYNKARTRGLFLISPMGTPMTKERLDYLRKTFSPKNLKDARDFAKRVHPSMPALATNIVSPVTLAWLQRQAFVDLVQGTTVDDGIAPHELQQLKAPVCIVAGTDDPIINPGTVEYFRSNIKSPTTILQPKGMGHCPQHDQPKIIARMILDFIKGLD
jgi:pimeloyl-ACP methyl ester carboxylesterase